MKFRLTILSAALLLASHGVARAQAEIGRDTPEVRCQRVESGSTGPCSANEFLLRKLDREGLGAALVALDSLAGRDPEVRRLGHAYAHSIGIAAYDRIDDVGELFGECSPIFQSGCYHGVIQGYFLAKGQDRGQELDSSLVNGLCTDQRSDPALRWHLFQCAHGLGHGLMMATGNHLPAALSACDLVADPWEREVCYSAVFMENIVQATAVDDLGRPNAVSHAHGASSGAPSDFPPLKREEPLYPCTVLEDRYLPACYHMQTSAILQLNRFDVAVAAEACPSAPESFRATCFQSLGRDISALTVQNHPKALALCAHAPVDYQPFCHLGYAKNLVDLTANPADGFEFCRLLDNPESKRLCYGGMGEQLWVLEVDPEVRSRACEDAEPEYVDVCRIGAGLERSVLLSSP